MLKTILHIILDWLTLRLFREFQEWRAEQERNKKIENETKKEAEAVKDAKDEDELEEAAKDILSRK